MRLNKIDKEYFHFAILPTVVLGFEYGDKSITMLWLFWYIQYSWEGKYE